MKLRTIKTISLLIALTLITGLVVGTLIMHGAASATLSEIKTVDSFPSASAKLQDLQFTILLFFLLLGSLLMVGMYFLYQELLSPAIKLSTQVNGEAPDLASIQKNLKYLQSQHTEAEKKLETLGCQLEELLAEKQNLEKALHSELSQQSSCLQSLGPPLATQDKLTNEISSEVDKAKQIAHESQGMAKRGRDVLKQTIDAMSAISDSSNQIAEITSMIDSIAFETNLLAINASIEAARAGQEGRGFAVVANEVRNLAQRSAGFAKDIKTLIEASSRRVNAGVLMANESGTTLTNIVNASNEVNQIVIQIGDSSSAQATTFHHLQDLLNEIMVIKESPPSLEAKPSPQTHKSSRPEIEAA